MAKTIATLYIDLDARMAKLEAGLNKGRKEVRDFAAETRKSMAESKAGIALLGEEIGVHLPRHLRTFLAGLPGVAPLMTAAFSTIAVLGLGKVAAEVGTKIYEWFKKNSEAAQKLQEGFRNINEPLKRANDELEVTNDRLANDIAKLEHKPQNNLKLALDEARLATDKLSDSIDKALAGEQKLLKEQGVSALGSFFSNRASTGDLADKIASVRGEFTRILEEGQLAADKALTTEEKTKALAEARLHAQQFINAELDKARTKMGDLQTAQNAPGEIDIAGLAGAPGTTPPQDLTTSITAWRDYASTLSQIKRGIELEDQNTALTTKKGGLENALAGAAEQLRRLQDQLKEQLAASTNGHEAQVLEERNFWQQHLAAFAQGSKEWLAVHAALNTAQRALNAESLKLNNGQEKSFDNLMAKLSKGATADFNKDLSAQQHAADVQRQTTLDRIKENAELDAGNVNWRVQTGLLSEAAGLRERMAIADAEWAAQTKVLNEELTSLQSLAIIDPEAAKRIEEIGKELDKLKSENQKTVGTLEGDLQSQSWSHAFDPLLRSAANVNLELRDIFMHTIDGLNTELARLVTGQHTNVGKLLQSAAGDLAKTGIQSLEGGLLKGLGLGGKPDGSAGNPIYTRSADLTAAAGGVSGGLGGLLGKLGGGIGGFFQKIFGLFGGFLAGGGEMDPSKFYVTGEHGPEIIGGTRGRVFNASQVAAGGSSSGAMYYIDARGADAAEVEARVQRSLAAVHGSAVATAYSAVNEMARRRPLGVQA